MGEKKDTSFGLLEILSEDPLIERMTFNKEGKSHLHGVSEHCYILNGSGQIIGSGDDERIYKTGELCSVKAAIKHYMIPHETPFQILIWYDTK